MGKEYRVYILQNSSGLRYIGLSETPEKRLQQHNQGRSKWTAKHLPWMMVWQSQSMSLSNARKLENLMKRQKGGKGLERLMNSHGSY